MSLTINDVPSVVAQTVEEEASMTSTYDVLNVLFVASNKLYEQGAAMANEKKDEFFARVSPVIIDYLVIYEAMAEDQASLIKSFTKRILKTTVDMVEDIVLLDLDSDGKIGRIQADDDEQISTRKGCFSFFKR